MLQVLYTVMVPCSVVGPSKAIEEVLLSVKNIGNVDIIDPETLQRRNPDEFDQASQAVMLSHASAAIRGVFLSMIDRPTYVYSNSSTESMPVLSSTRELSFSPYEGKSE